MFLSDFSIRRPVAMIAIIIVLLLAGINSYRKLGLDNMPDIEIPYVTITTVYPGASPGEIEVDVAKKIEDAVTTIDGLKHVHSTCMENMCLTTLEFDLSVDVDVAGVDVREKVDLILDDLPDDVESPKILKFDPNAKPIVTLLMTGDLPIDQLYDFADEQLSDRLSTVPGVAEVQVAGGEELEVHIILDKEKLAAHNLSTADIIKFLALNNIKIPSGSLKDGIQEVSITFDAEFGDLREMEALEVGNSDKGRIYIRDIGAVKMISKENRTIAFYNGKPAVNVKIVKKGEANAVRVVERIRKAVDEIKRSNILPGGMNLIWFTDDGEFIRASVDDAWGSIALGIALTAFILFIFLHEIRSTVIVCLSMPTSIVITFMIMKYFDYTLNNSTLLALGTSVGVLVTNSIVVIENVFKKLREGLSPLKAAAEGTSEVALPVFASASTNVVVFVPIAMMSSLVGRYFIPFAVTMTAATLVSLFISFTLTPILSEKFLKSKMPQHKWLMRTFIRYWEKFYGGTAILYGRSLDRFSKHPWVILLLVLLLLIATFIFIVPHVGSSFFPDNDRGEFVVKIEFPTDYNIETTTKRTLDIEKRLRQLKGILDTSTVIGKIQGTIGQVSEGVHLAEITVKTTPKTERNMNIDQMKDVFRQALKNDLNCIVTVNVPSVIGGSSSEIEMEISGFDLEKLDQLGVEAIKKAKASGMMADLDSSVRPGKPEIRIIPRRPILHDMKLSSYMLGQMMRGNIEGIKVGTYKIGDRSYDIRVELEEQKGVKQINEFTLMSKDGHPLSIDTVADLENSNIPIQISRAEKKRIIKLYANPASGVALGDSVKAMTELVNEILPVGYNMRFTGKVEKMKEAQLDFLEAIITASLLTYLLIAAILESWTQPFIILFTLPLALIGLFTALFITGQSLSMMGLLGAVMLIGIVVNNAILIIDNVVILRSQGMPPKEAMLISAKEKFRPIVMTSIAAVIGILPMAIGNGLGSELRSSCGIGVVGGLISSTILSIYVIPLMYIQFVKGKKAKETVETSES
jgi:HAE1 family hydrophobic/amphiphilic exporter-1